MNIGQFFFKTRSYTPIPLIVAVFAIPHSASIWEPLAGDIPALVLIGLAGLLVMVLGECIRVIAVAYASPATRTRNVGASRLFCKGPYARVRNPLYIGNFLILVGMLIMSWTWFPWLMIIGILFYWVQYHFIVRLEEEALVRDLGDEYVEYTKNVPRFMPRLKPYESEGGRDPDYKKAWKSERRTLTSEAILILMILIRWYLVLR